VIAIAGAAGNLGPTVVRRLAPAGARLALGGRDLAQLDALAAQLGGGMDTAAVDLLDAPAARAWADGAAERFGHVDALVHLVGGWWPSAPIEEASLEDWGRFHDLLIRTYQHATQAFARHLLASGRGRVVLVSPIFFTIGCFATSVLNSYQRFLLAALAPTMYNLGIIVGAALLAPLWGVYGLAAGAALGSVLFLLVQLPGLRRVGMVYRPRLDLRHEGVAAIGKLMLPRSFGLAVAQVNFLVALVLASGMAERYAALNYAWLLTTMPLGVFAMAISTAVFPTLAEHSARDELAALKRTLSTALRLILFLTIPASIGLIVLGEPITKLLFERGQFTPAATQATAFALQFYAPGLFALALIEILARAFYALKDTRTPVLVAILGMAVNTALGVLLIRTALGYGGLALAMMLAAAVESLVLLAVARRRLGGLEERRLAVALGKHCLAAILMGVAVYAFAQGLLGYLNPGLSLHLLLLVGSSMVVGVVSYVAVAAALRCEEVARVRQALPVGKVV